MNIAINIFTGLFISVLIFALPLLLLMGFLPSGNLGAGGGTAIALVFPILSAAFLIFAAIVQLLVTTAMRHASKWTILGIWLIYPVAFVSFWALSGYISLRQEIAHKSDYSGRSINGPPPEKIRNLLINEPARRTQGTGSRDNCERFCIEVLGRGLLDSVVRPNWGTGLGFLVFRHARGSACQLAIKNNQTHEKIVSRRKSIRGHRRYNRNLNQVYTTKIAEDVEKVKQELKNNLQEIMAAIRQPRLHVGPTRFLQLMGHFDQCITVQQQISSHYDIRIDYGPEFARPYGPKRGVADIYAYQNARDVLLSRWEYGRSGSHSRKALGFELSTIISELKKKHVADKITPFPVEDIESELKRVFNLLDRGAYIYNHSSKRTIMPAWLGKVFKKTYLENKKIHIDLNTEELNYMLRIMTFLTKWDQASLDKKLYYYIDQEDTKYVRDNLDRASDQFRAKN